MRQGRASSTALAVTLGLTLAFAPAAGAQEEDDSCGTVTYKKVKGKGTVREGSFRGGGGIYGPVRKHVGKKVEQRRLTGDETYYVPRGLRIRVTIRNARYYLSGGSFFIPSCALEDSLQEVRLLRGKAVVSGPRVRNKPRATLTTPEASLSPLPGIPRYTVRRTVTDTAKRTRTQVETSSRRSSSSIFVNVIGPNSRGVSCRRGKDVTVYGTGRVKQ